MVKATTELEKTLLNHLQKIAIELGCSREKVEQLDIWGLQDIIIKDIHISRILRERDKKALKKLQREINIAKQLALPIIRSMKEFA